MLQCPDCRQEIPGLPCPYCESNKREMDDVRQMRQRATSVGRGERGIALNDKSWEFYRGMAVGRIAESLIEQLFLSQGYEVFRYGMENTVPGIMRKIQSKSDPVSTSIRRMPDLVVWKDDEPYFIEVKYRGNGEFKLEDPDTYPYDQAFFVVVTKEGFRCISLKELKNGGFIVNNGRFSLAERPEFNFNERTLERFESLARDMFKNLRAAKDY